jgi:hypothetical protein
MSATNHFAATDPHRNGHTPHSNPPDSKPANGKLIELTPRQRKLLEQATGEPQTMPTFARKAGYSPGNHVYTELTELARHGLLMKAPGGGYQLPPISAANRFHAEDAYRNGQAPPASASPKLAGSNLSPILALLAELCERGEPVHVQVSHGGIYACLTVKAIETHKAPDVSPLEQSILRVAGVHALPAKKLAGLLSKNCNSHFRDQLRGLVRRGLLIHTADGYRLP